MAPIAAMAPAGSQSAILSDTDTLLKRGHQSLRRASTLYRPRQQQQLPTQQHGEEGRHVATSCHSSLQAHGPRDRQSYQVAPRQQLLYLPGSQRPASSRSHMRDWDHQRTRSRSPSSSTRLPLSDSSSQQTQAESYSSGQLPSSASMTSEEFEALPPTVQRKVSICFFLLLLVLSPVLSMLLSSGGKQVESCERCLSIPFYSLSLSVGFALHSSQACACLQICDIKRHVCWQATGLASSCRRRVHNREAEQGENTTKIESTGPTAPCAPGAPSRLDNVGYYKAWFQALPPTEGMALPLGWILVGWLCYVVDAGFAVDEQQQDECRGSPTKMSVSSVCSSHLTHQHHLLGLPPLQPGRHTTPCHAMQCACGLARN